MDSVPSEREMPPVDVVLSVPFRPGEATSKVDIGLALKCGQATLKFESMQVLFDQVFLAPMSLF